MTNVMGRISSGLRVQRAQDDAAGLSVATTNVTHARSASQAIRNTNDGISILETAEGASKEVSEILARMRMMAVSSSSETLADRERGYLTDEYDELRSEIQRIAQGTEFNGILLADGTRTSLDVQVGVESNGAHRISIGLGNLTTSALGLGSITASGTAAGLQMMDMVDGAIESVNDYRSGFGAIYSRLERAFSSNEDAELQNAAAASRILDADFARETSEMTRYQIMQQAGIAALAQSERFSESVVTLLA